VPKTHRLRWDNEIEAKARAINATGVGTTAGPSETDLPAVRLLVRSVKPGHCTLRGLRRPVRRSPGGAPTLIPAHAAHIL